MFGKKADIKKVYVGLSGGVDSSVSAALLKEEGCKVTGVFIKVWQPDFINCTWKEDRLDAMRVCAELEIPFLTLDLEDVYKRNVIDYMIKEYKKGNTPNPDVMCNKYVKFGAFLNWALKDGADAVATGHYANIFYKNSRPSLYTSSDINKDQTYFLWTLKEEELEKILFPVGCFKKDKTRIIAKKYNLPTSNKKDSQGLCFIGELDMKEFLSNFIDTKPGKVVTKDGSEVGLHDGAELYTIGERHGFKITDKSVHAPLYVVDKDLKSNKIIVSDTPSSKETSISEISLENTNWIGKTPDKNKIYKVRLRHRGEMVESKISTGEDKTASVLFIDKQKPLSLGQSAVFYEKPTGARSDRVRCIGGGIIS